MSRFDIRTELATTYRGKEYWVAIDYERADYADDTGVSGQGTGHSERDAVLALIDELLPEGGDA